ncbi:phage terminase small subunit [Halomonas sp. GD1P12]|uniref:phage terminase small subunit n=1 Tax=Halomonas sp. GD1P12 TaxID=2982691 RepID=UPI0021E44135|nr:phage terminase small subunit [Halomonas sp. GD1P12]UYF99319.1 phage terminase small subunit [Halomonas sp. GD1P12]
MKSPARKHFERVTAAKAAGAAKPGQPQTGEQYELHAAALYEARRTLKGIKSIQAKIEKKREVLPDFLPYVDGVLAEGAGAKDDVLMTMMIWCIDIGEFGKALEIGTYAVKHDLDTPDQYDRDTVSILAEEIAEGVKAQLEQEGADADALANVMARTVATVGDHDMHDQIKAKLHKSYGYALRAADDHEGALAQLKEALALNERIGVKQDIQQLERLIKNAGGKASA